MTEPMVDALQYLSSEFSCTRDEWRNHHRGGDMLLDGLVSKGYANTKSDRFAVSDAGRRFLEAMGPVEAEAE